MAHDIVSADNALREYLHAQARDFLMLMVSTLLEHSAESGQAAYDQLHGRVDALAAGDEVWISRYELPDDHPQAAPHGGHPATICFSTPTTCCALSRPSIVARKAFECSERFPNAPGPTR